MKQVKTIGIRILGLLVILVLANWIYTKFIFENDLEKYSSIIQKVRAVDANTQILYMGESSNKTFHKNDLDKRKISQMLQDFYPDVIISDITQPAAHLGIYYELLRQIPFNSNIETVVVTLNLRSFGLDWILSKLESSLQKSLVLLKPYPPLVNRFLLSFKAYPNYSEKGRRQKIRKLWKEENFDTTKMPFPSVFEWDRGMARQGIRDSFGQYDQVQTELACHYIKSYAFTMDKHNRVRLRDVDRLIALSKERNWNLVFNLMAENVQKAEELVGEDLLKLMRTNRDYLLSYLRERSISVVDNLETVDDAEYIDQDWTTEHYTEKGRRSIAQNLAIGLQDYYSEDFVQKDSNYIQPHVFFHDGEQDYHWGQKQWFTEELAFSGKRSVKVAKQKPYGLTFSCALDQLPELYRNGVGVEFMLSGASHVPPAKLVIDLILENGQNQWNGLPIKTLGQGKWNEFQTKMYLPPNTKSLKIYVLNESEVPMFIDDLKISFY